MKYNAMHYALSIITLFDSISTHTRISRGLGPWSVDMFMMFTLCNPDVMPLGDLGVRRGIYRLHGLTASANKGSKALKEETARCRELTTSWSPYSSIGKALHLSYRLFLCLLLDASLHSVRANKDKKHCV